MFWKERVEYIVGNAAKLMWKDYNLSFCRLKFIFAPSKPYNKPLCAFTYFRFISIECILLLHNLYISENAQSERLYGCCPDFLLFTIHDRSKHLGHVRLKWPVIKGNDVFFIMNGLLHSVFLSKLPRSLFCSQSRYEFCSVVHYGSNGYRLPC